ncbi:MAG: sigma-54-dependent Fis family transcriptional regulator [Myxococcales bacterium]|jgi:two-component system nitrogen regulation response regulator GlnG|nr:sigma-54-dependent Fis family transcriptional regulator [Myxococcales bacterium]
MAGRPWSQATSTEMVEPLAVEAGELRVVGLTILYHPELERVGERALLTGLEQGREFALSRGEPLFSAPGAAAREPLAERGLSRAPIWLRGAAARAVVLDPGDSRTRVELGGQAVDRPTVIARAELELGVVLLLAGRVVLLLHLLEPATDAGQPNFGLIGYSPAMVAVRRDIRKVSDFAVPVLVRGESGTGKELVARAIHDASARRSKPYVAVNLAAVPPTLAASELFGAVRGAFTGARDDRQGAFLRAQGGTLFLDEVGEAPPELQVMLLRSLEAGEILPVGADKPRAIDVRVVAATDAALEAAIAAERFRAPLYYRLAGFVIRLPPLRERREDLGRLLVAFLRAELSAAGDQDALRDDGREPWLPAAAVARLVHHAFPGNVRQLANVVRHLVIANRGLRPAVHLQVLDELAAWVGGAAGQPPAAAAGDGEPSRARALAPRPADISEAQLERALREHRYSPERAAEALGIPRASIYRLMDRSTRVRKASSLSAAEILAAQARTSGSDEAVAELLEVSVRALRRRIGELALDSAGRKRT